MNRKVIDLTRARNALAELDRLAAEHPERCNQGGPKWADNLPELDKLTMGTPVKTRIKDYRARLRAKGYKASTVYLSATTHERLLRLSQQARLAYGDLIGLALEQYEPDMISGQPDEDAYWAAEGDAALDRLARGEDSVITLEQWEARHGLGG